MSEQSDQTLDQPKSRPPGTVEPWEFAKPQLGEMTGDERLVRQSWEELDAWAYAFVWHCLVSF